MKCYIELMGRKRLKEWKWSKKGNLWRFYKKIRAILLKNTRKFRRDWAICRIVQLWSLGRMSFFEFFRGKLIGVIENWKDLGRKKWDLWRICNRFAWRRSSIRWNWEIFSMRLRWMWRISLEIRNRSRKLWRFNWIKLLIVLKKIRKN